MTSKGNEAHAGDAASDAQAQNIREDATTPPDRRSAWRLLGLTACFAIAFIYLAYASFSFRDPALASRCEMAWMSPGYLRMDGLTEQHSRLARKYTLWLYREQGWDLSNKVRGRCCIVQYCCSEIEALHAAARRACPICAWQCRIVRASAQSGCRGCSLLL